MRRRRRSSGSRRTRLIDTVYLVAYFRPSDPLHREAVGLIEGPDAGTGVSQAAVIEFDLLMKTRGFRLEERIRALRLLDAFLRDRVEPLLPADLAAAAHLSEVHGLDYFDSLFAAQCLLRGAEPLTVDGEILRAVGDDGIGRELTDLLGDLARSG